MFIWGAGSLEKPDCGQEYQPGASLLKNQCVVWYPLGLFSSPELTSSGSVSATNLTAACSHGKATCASANVSALGILRENLSREATKQQRRVSMSFELDSGAVEAVLQALWPALRKQSELDTQVKLLQALEELRLQVRWEVVKRRGRGRVGKGNLWEEYGAGSGRMGLREW